ncbi:MAG: DUF488 family protein [Hyphomicrobiales bacterium]|nr:DUF488 family protein [Hyphomicrobiales bacterium]MDE1973002.1 DUF488 family protein [Hyphomicrobiales bacterium]MDE2285689.1 DUF488 family protein [Hyphomicrobiales bacterium]
MAKRAKPAKFNIKRIYEPAAEGDGLRVLVDRLWPRGIAKQKAHIDQWLKDVAPSHELRRRYHDKSAEWKQFVAAYGRELKQEPARGAAASLREQLRHGPVTLLYASRNEAHNNAVALKNWLERAKPRRGQSTR